MTTSKTTLQLYERAERLARIAQQNMTLQDQKLDALISKFVKTIENRQHSGESLQEAYQAIFERLTGGVDDG